MSVSPKLDEYLIYRFKLPLDSLHGPSHWSKVLEVGLKLSSANNADREVIRLFSLLHDSCRENEYDDQEHGKRSALLAEELRGKYFDINDEQFEALSYACEHHTDGFTSDNVTIGTCWDADRLDLGRVGIAPTIEFLSTTAGKEYLKSVEIQNF